MIRIPLFLVSVLLLYLSFIHAERNISITRVPCDTAVKYQTYEIELKMQGIEYNNPYDPQQVDLAATFTAPSGKVWQIFGFYDNYRNCDAWKVRFCPNETGQWEYTLAVTDVKGKVKSKTYIFTVNDSPAKGWIKLATTNPYYFEYDNGSTFFGIGMYYPWYINSFGLDRLEDAGANMFGYWNIVWDAGIIESMESGLGRYDQKACARIDEIVRWAEQRDMKMMLAIWPHDLLAGPRLENTGWSKRWHENPYNQLSSAEDFYASEQAWKYQEKQYRYIIARWGASPALGIWEIVNEINGTDGGDNTPEALAWVKRVHAFFKMHDPYNKPTTANQSGGRYWTEGYKEVDIPTIHVYENQFDENPFPGQPLRSSYTLYYRISKYFRENFKKPAFMGEAGFTAPDNVFGDFSSESAEYDTLYHNALWACWAGGNAATPMWWDFGSRRVVTQARLDQLKIFAGLTKDIDYAHIPFVLAKAEAHGADVFAMAADSIATGWMREIKGKSIAAKKVIIEGLVSADFKVKLYNPWTAEKVAELTEKSADGRLMFSLPGNYMEADVVFIAKVKR